MAMSGRAARNWLNALVDDAFSVIGANELSVDFSDDFSCGYGEAVDKGDALNVTIGIRDFSGFVLGGVLPVSREKLVRVGVTIFHEARHCEQYRNIGMDSDLASSLAAGFYNPEWYRQNRFVLLSEIDAEWHGISKFWDKLVEKSSGEADKLMCDYVNFRAGEGNYFISAKEDGYQSRVEIERAFERARVESLDRFRKSFVVPAGNRCSDEFVRVLRLNERNGSPFWDFYWNNFSGRVSGRDIDRNMTAVGMIRHEDEYREQFGNLLDGISFESRFGRTYESFLKSDIQEAETRKRVSEPVFVRFGVSPSKTADGAGARCTALAEEMAEKDREETGLDCP